MRPFVTPTVPFRAAGEGFLQRGFDLDARAFPTLEDN
jgi:hypothetical protein